MTKAEREERKLTILQKAAEIILETNNPQVDIKELALRCKVLRPIIYSWFGSKDIKLVIFDSIVSHFLGRAASIINIAMQTADPRKNTPIDQLRAILRGTLVTFRQDPLFGKVVLRHLNLEHESFALVREGLNQLGEIILRARKAGQIEEDNCNSDDWKIGFVLFSVTYGLLRILYFNEGVPPKGCIDENFVTSTMFLILGGYCTTKIRTELNESSILITD